MSLPKLAVFKFASCDGCQLSLLDCEDELLALAERVEISHFLEASSQHGEGPVRPRSCRSIRSPRGTMRSASTTYANRRRSS